MVRRNLPWPVHVWVCIAWMHAHTCTHFSQSVSLSVFLSVCLSVCLFPRIRKTLTSNDHRNHAHARRILRHVNRLRERSAIWAVYINYNRKHAPTSHGPRSQTIHNKKIFYYSTTHTSIHDHESKFKRPSTFRTCNEYCITCGCFW